MEIMKLHWLLILWRIFIVVIKSWSLLFILSLSHACVSVWQLIFQPSTCLELILNFLNHSQLLKLFNNFPSQEYTGDSVHYVRYTITYATNVGLCSNLQPESKTTCDTFITAFLTNRLLLLLNLIGITRSLSVRLLILQE